MSDDKLRRIKKIFTFFFVRKKAHAMYTNDMRA